jgi:hypothetical protein
LIVEDGVVCSDQPDVTEAGDQWFSAVVARNGDLKARPGSPWGGDGGLVAGRHRGDRGVVLVGQRLEHGGLHNPAEPLESEEIPGEQVVLDIAPVLGSEFRDDGEVVVMDHRMPGGGFAARAVQGTFGVDDVFGHAQPYCAVDRPTTSGDLRVAVLGQEIIAKEPRPPGLGVRD